MKELSIKQLRLPTRLSQAEFAEKFCIPKSTLQQWESGKRKPPAYVPLMIFTILQMELKIKPLYPNTSCMACDPEGGCTLQNANCDFYTCMSVNYETLLELEEDYAALDDKEGE